VIPKPVAESGSTDMAGDGAEGNDGARSDGGSEEE